MTGESASRRAPGIRLDEAMPPPAPKVLLPRRQRGGVARQRLLDFLHRHLDRRLQLVVTPPGYCKTTLLAAFAHEVRDQGMPVCWLTLDAADADAHSIFEHLVLSLRQQFPAFGQRTTALLRSVENADQEYRAVATALANEVAEQIDEFFVFILDDYPAGGDGASLVHRAVDGLLQGRPADCHLLLGTEAIPTQLRLADLARRRDVAGLGIEDLRLRPEEAAALIRARAGYAVHVHPKQAERIVDQAEGWVTAILLSFHAQETDLCSGLRRARAAEGSPYAHLATRVLDRLPQELRTFLPESTVLPVLSAAECDAVLGRGDSAARLAKVLQQALFVEPLEARAPGADDGAPDDGAPDDGAGWLRYHRRWRNFLLKPLLETAPRRLAELRRRAANRAWEQGHRPEA
ncbi:MAG: hypothetical protein ACRDJN_01975, partial [Chloroflexota bacterium]